MTLDQDIENIRTLLDESYGMVFDDHSVDRLIRAIQARIEQTGSRHPHQYWHELSCGLISRPRLASQCRRATWHPPQ